MELKLNERDKELIKENASLSEYASELLRRQEQLMNVKAYKEEQRQKRIKMIEDNFVTWSEKKTHEYEQKKEKACKIKLQHLDRIVKRCKDQDKFNEKKSKEYKIKKNSSLNEAWKKAESFNQDIMKYHQSKLSKTKKKSCTQPNKQQTKSINLEDSQNRVKSQPKYINKSMTIVNPSHVNRGNFGNMFHFTQYIEPTKDQSSEDEGMEESAYERQEKNYKRLEIHRQKQIQFEKQRIQQLGEKMQKIQKSRIKREQLHKKKKSQTEGNEIERNFQSTSGEKLKKQPNKQKYQLKMEQLKQEKRVKNWQTQNRQKRREAFEQHFENGNTYLKKLKLKNLKTILAKNIAFNAMEKKLYYDRLKN